MSKTLLVAVLGFLALAGCASPRTIPQSAAGTAGTEEVRTLAFPGALGWAAETPGGRGGRVIRVTTLARAGPGSLRAAIETTGPRIIVFEVGGVIDLNRTILVIREPFVTIAGQTAPSPGITLIRGGMDILTHDVVVQHIRVRPGEAGAAKASGWEVDAISTRGGARNVIVDHCTLTWATDENLSASGPRFEGATPEAWRLATSQNITFSNNIIAEGLANSTHAKLEHSKGSLIHDNVTNILIIGNLYAHNVERNPLFKGGVRGAVVNNLIYNPGLKALHYNLQAEEWDGRPYQTGQMVAVGNVLRAGPSTSPLAFLSIGGYGDLEYFGKDNIAIDRVGKPLPMMGRYTTSPARIIKKRQPPFWPAGLSPLPARDVQEWVLRNAGARPWDRDSNDVRLIADVAEGRGRIIDSEKDVHGYPIQKPARRRFKAEDWDLSTMTPINPDALDSATKSSGT
jgi:pectate lyase